MESIFGLFISAPFLFLGIWLLRKTIRLKKACTIPIEGIITGRFKSSQKDDDEHREDIYHFTYKYHINNTTFNSSTSGYREESSYMEGDKIKLMYNPKKPAENCVLNEMDWTNIVGASVAIFLGGGFTLLILFFLINQ